MKYALDSSVAIKTVLPEVDSDKAVRLIDEFCQGIHEFLAPKFFMSRLLTLLLVQSGKAGSISEKQ